MTPDGPSTDPGRPDVDDAPVPAALAASWQQAETLAYSTVTERPDLYQQAIRLVRLTADHLRLLGPGTGALVAAAQRGTELVGAVMDDSGIRSTELDLDVVARAAFALRYREVMAEQAALRRLRRVAEGRAAGQAWVVAEESGAPEGDPFLPYARLEVEVATGRALLVTADPDDDYRGCVHSVRTMRLDLGTGAVDADRSAQSTHPDAEAREAAAAQLRGGTGGP
jgi:hypothetical protein